MYHDYLPPLLVEKLRYFVYLYINPLNGQIFYIGKGHGSRCLANLSDLAESRKVQTIREIQAAGLQPKIEAAVIDLLGKSALTNQVRGYETVVFGRMLLEILSAIYQKEPVRVEEPAILIRVNKTYTSRISKSYAGSHLCG